jgi:phytoene/squalene synthetase
MLAEKTVTDEIKMLIKFELERTDALYKRADKGIFMLPAFAGKGIYVARVLYSALHRKIMKQGYDTLKGRTRLSTLHKTWLIVCTLFTYRIQRWYATKRHHIFHE